MRPGELLAELGSRFDGERAADFDGRLCITAGGEELHIHIFHGELRTDHAGGAECTLYFETADEAVAILSGAAHPIDAFMAGRFRTSGYLMWIWPLLTMFTRPTQ